MFYTKKKNYIFPKNISKLYFHIIYTSYVNKCVKEHNGDLED